MEILCVRGGRGEFIVGGNQFTAEPGDIVVANTKEIHSIKSSEPIELCYLLLYPDFFRDVSFSGPMISNFIKNDEYAYGLLLSILAEEESATPGCDMMQKSLAYSLIAHLMRSYQKESMSEKKMELHGVALERLSRVMELVAEKYNEQISTRDLAAASYLSEGHFCRFFKSATGKSPLDYLTDYRIDRAAALLSGSDLTLSEIGESVGLGETNYFCRVFRKRMGISPAKYRAKCRLTSDGKEA